MPKPTPPYIKSGLYEFFNPSPICLEAASAMLLDLPSTKQKETALIYTALKFGSSSDSEFHDLIFPLGRISYRLWPGLKKFIQLNDIFIKKEINIIKKFTTSKFKN